MKLAGFMIFVLGTLVMYRGFKLKEADRFFVGITLQATGFLMTKFSFR